MEEFKGEIQNKRAGRNINSFEVNDVIALESEVKNKGIDKSDHWLITTDGLELMNGKEIIKGFDENLYLKVFSLSFEDELMFNI